MKKQLTILALGGIILFSGVNFAQAQERTSLVTQGSVNAQVILRGDNLKSVIKQSGTQGLVEMMTKRLDMILSHPKVTAELRARIEALKVRLQANQPFEKKDNRDSIKTLWQNILKDTMQLRRESRNERAYQVFGELDAHIAKLIERDQALKLRAEGHADAIALIVSAEARIATAKTNLATAKARLATEDLDGLKNSVKEGVFQILKMAHKDLQAAFEILKEGN
ncbi:MAG: hypothetical protein EXS49_02060 [Candidatus Pacebacteria bacterium]|nr:hypothetical protein [Candidatus Paceibacterota bacterium]